MRNRSISKCLECCYTGRVENIKRHIKKTGKCPNPGANVIKQGPKPKEEILQKRRDKKANEKQ